MCTQVNGGVARPVYACNSTEKQVKSRCKFSACGFTRKKRYTCLKEINLSYYQESIPKRWYSNPICPYAFPFSFSPLLISTHNSSPPQHLQSGWHKPEWLSVQVAPTEKWPQDTVMGTVCACYPPCNGLANAKCSYTTWRKELRPANQKGSLPGSIRT